ncbi:MAG: RHS repeat-associated core domain-containing protein, partial [Acidobacteriota bacterium]
PSDFVAFGNRRGINPFAGYIGPFESIRQRFTTYYRDDETGGFDFAEARYYVSMFGRFLSPDPLVSSARPGNPQTWNRYAYVLNNPVNLTDPNGLAPQGGEDETSFNVAGSFLKGVGNGLANGVVQIGKAVVNSFNPISIIEGNINTLNTATDAANAYGEYLNDANKINAAVAGAINTLGLNKTAEIVGDAIGQVGSQVIIDRLLPAGPSKQALSKLDGTIFENAVLEELRLPKNNLKLPGVTRKGIVNTTPDALGGRAGVLEIKNDAKLAFGSQQEAQAYVARQRGTSYNLVIGPRTKTISLRLQRAVIQSGGTIVEFNSTTRSFRSVTFDRIHPNKVVR